MGTPSMFISFFPKEHPKESFWSSLITQTLGTVMILSKILWIAYKNWALPNSSFSPINMAKGWLSTSNPCHDD